MVLCSFSSLPCNLLFTNQAGGDLYNPCDKYSAEALMCYLQSIPLPALTQKACLELDAPFTLGKSREAASSFPTCKTPGDDGIPMEVYIQYGEVILPKLLELFNTTSKMGQLPTSCPGQMLFFCSSQGKIQ